MKTGSAFVADCRRQPVMVSFVGTYPSRRTVTRIHRTPKEVRQTWEDAGEEFNGLQKQAACHVNARRERSTCSPNPPMSDVFTRGLGLYQHER